MRSVVAALALCFITGCPVGPNYRRPVVPTPDTTRGQQALVEAASLADAPWWDVFDDPVLQAHVESALRGSLDLQAAAARVERARELVAVARGDVFPQVGYQGGVTRQRGPVAGAASNVTYNAFIGTFNLAWEIDVWGRIRRATEAARAEYLAAEESRRGVLLSLVSDVAETYFELLELDTELGVARRTESTFNDTVDLFTRRFKGGIGNLLEVSRATANRDTASAVIAELQRQITIKENQLSVLLGRPPGDIERGRGLDAQHTPPEIPVGVSAQLLERRPDIRQAEHAVASANADVGVAIASFFPRIGLTTLYGAQSSELENLVKSGGNVWAIAGTLAGPLFQGGRLLANYGASRAQWEESVLRYQQTALQAFAEVSNTLVTHQQLRIVRLQRADTVKQLQRSVDLSLQRYDDGIANYFEVLESQQQLFPAELDLARVQRDQLIAVVQLYRALGGGWQLRVPEWSGHTDG